MVFKSRKFTLLSLSLLTLTGFIASSCNQVPAVDPGVPEDPQTEIKTYSITRDDALTVDEIVGSDVVLPENYTLQIVDTSYLKNIDNKLFAKKVGTTQVKVFENDSSLFYTFNLKVEDYEELTTDAFSRGGSFGGILIDVMADRHLSKGQKFSYNISVDDVTNNDQDLSVAMSNPAVATDVIINGSHYINCLSVGDTIMKIYNADGNLIFRDVVKVRYAAKTKNEATYFLLRQDYWLGVGGFDGIYGSTRIYFLDDGTGFMTGSDVGISFGQLTFTYSFDETRQDEDFLAFNIIDFQGTDFTFTYLQMFRCGDQLLTYIRSGSLLEMYVPKSNK